MTAASPPPSIRHDAAALALSVKEFFDLARSEQLIPLLARGFENSTGEPPSPAERRSWESSLPALGRVLSHPELSDFKILLEFTLPLSFGRIDAILLHDRPAGPIAFIVELKAWSTVSPMKGEVGTNYNVKVANLGATLNPALKAMQYQAALTEFATFAQAVSFRSLAFTYNLPRKVGASVLLREEAATYAPNTPIFFQGEEAELQSYLVEELGPGSAAAPEPTYEPWATASMFLRGAFSHGKGFLSYLEEYAAATEPELGSLTGLRVPLPEDQLAVLLAVRTALASSERHLILVRGCAGAGKSLLAFGAVLNAIRAGYRASITFKNKILHEVLSETLPSDPIRNRTYSDALFKFPGSFGRNSNLDLIACDEAQRFSRRHIQALDDAARVLLVLYDERQRLLPSEEGDEKTFIANATNRRVQTFSLGTSRRIKDGASYLPWVESLLYGEGQLPSPSRLPASIQICPTLSQLVERLDGLRHQDVPTSGGPPEVALLASFTETDGRNGPDCRIRTKSPKLLWEMPGGYGDFWVRRTRNNLTHCASVYGCQGLEADYLGLIWGNDLVIRDGRWAIHERNTITDYLGHPNSLQALATSPRPEDRAQALELLKNRYYILLTRAALGTAIHCEDEETGAYLMRLGAQ